MDIADTFKAEALEVQVLPTATGQKETARSWWASKVGRCDPLEPFRCKQTTMWLAIKLLERESVADRAWGPVRAIAYNPQLSAVVLTVIYLVYLVLWMAWAPVARLSEGCAWLLALLAVRRVSACVARFATFPGSFRNVQLDLEREYGNRLAQRLETAARYLEIWWIDTHPRACVDIDIDTFARHVEEASVMRQNLRSLLESMALVSSGPLAGDAAGDLGTIEWNELSAEAADAFAAIKAALEHALAACTGLEQLTARLLACDTTNFARARREAVETQVGGGAAAYEVATACRELVRCAGLVLPQHRAAAAAAMASMPNQRAGDVAPPTRGPLAEAASAVRSVLRAPCPKPLDSAFGLTLLRAELTRSFGATQFWVENARDGTKIDCCFIPPRFERQSSDSSLSVLPKPVPTVLFCAPNAVLYESFGMSPREGYSWVATYARNLGLQVVVWNLRGYGRTKGLPSPADNGADGVAIVDYLRSVCGVPALLVHGESIGGMVATNIAHHYCNEPNPEHSPPVVRALVADRTFSNLAIEAQYLTGIRASATALWLATMWRARDTDSLGKFIAAACPKLIASDACDHMIPDQASLKAGVAMLSELGDGAPRRRDLDRKLAISDALGQPPGPPIYRADLLPQPEAGDDLSWRLTDAAIAHFVACARHVANAARSSSSPSDACGDEREDEDVAANGSTARKAVGLTFFSAGGAATRRRQRHSRGSSRRSLHATNHKRRSMTWSPTRQSGEEDDGDEEVPPARSPSRSLSREESSSPQTPEAIAWHILQSVDGGCGQALGRALEADLGAVRAWVCSYATWPNGAPNKLIDGVLDTWCLDSEDEVLADDQESTAAQISVQSEKQLAMDVPDAAAALDELLDQEAQRCAHTGARPVLDSLKFVSSFLHALSARANRNARCGDRSTRLGSLLVLGCGHNAPYSLKEREAFLAWLKVNFLDHAVVAKSGTFSESPHLAPPPELVDKAQRQPDMPAS